MEWLHLASRFNRRRALRNAGEIPAFEADAVLGRLDIAMDAFNPDISRDALEIDEGELRRVADEVIAELRALGYLQV